MDFNKIKIALAEDEMNSGLGIIVHELENEGYTVEVNGQKVTSDGIFEGNFEELEKENELIFVLFQSNELVEKYKIDFIDFYEIEFKELTF
ncbi:MAG: hypothetical protein KF816_06435 [Melioribacteraceae bacterium]|nr:hypothetical protein [Melioribacteraceae bacterium]